MKEYYRVKGYSFTNFGDVFEIDVVDLPPSSDVFVEVSCDYCGENFRQQMKSYNQSIAKGPACCANPTCKGKKISARKIQYYSEEKPTIDTSAFLADSPQLAYLAGLLVTDGTVSVKDYRVELTMADRDVVAWAASFVKCSNPIREVLPRQAQHSVQWRVHFSNRIARETLERYGVVANKSLITTFPDLPDDLLPHYVRGVFDGDGSVQFNSAGKGFVSISFMTGSLEFAQGLKDVIECVLGFRVTMLRTANKKSGEKRYYRVTFTKIDSVRRFFNWIYEPGYFAMKRKRNKYMECLQKYDAVRHS